MTWRVRSLLSLLLLLTPVKSRWVAAYRDKQKSRKAIDPQAHRENMNMLNGLKAVTPDTREDLELESR